MAHRADDIRHDIADTRAAMTEKLAMLEERVRETIADTQASVEEIVENVQGTVEDTIATAQRTFDLPSQVEQHPWPMFGGALLVGYMLGSWGDGRTSAAGSTRDVQSARPQPQQGIISGIRDQFKDEMVSLRIIAVRAVMSTLREMFTQAIPTVAPHIDSAMTKRGGQPIASPEQHPAFMSRAAANGVPS